ncbi:MAG: hypothetical protein HZB27_12820 [Meiothermus silvanus]|nr:hypothetical protein [Allomeiothermus silvanus]
MACNEQATYTVGETVLVFADIRDLQNNRVGPTPKPVVEYALCPQHLLTPSTSWTQIPDVQVEHSPSGWRVDGVDVGQWRAWFVAPSYSGRLSYRFRYTDTFTGIETGEITVEP